MMLKMFINFSYKNHLPLKTKNLTTELRGFVHANHVHYISSRIFCFCFS